MPNDLSQPSVGAIADIGDYVRSLGMRAKAASRIIANASTKQKNAALVAAADALLANSSTIVTANRKDVTDAVARGYDDAFIDRLTLDEERIRAMADGVRAVASLAEAGRSFRSQQAAAHVGIKSGRRYAEPASGFG